MLLGISEVWKDTRGITVNSQGMCLLLLLQLPVSAPADTLVFCPFNKMKNMSYIFFIHTGNSN